MSGYSIVTPRSKQFEWIAQVGGLALRPANSQQQVAHGPTKVHLMALEEMQTNGILMPPCLFPDQWVPKHCTGW